MSVQPRKIIIAEAVVEEEDEVPPAAPPTETVNTESSTVVTTPTTPLPPPPQPQPPVQSVSNKPIAGWSFMQCIPNREGIPEDMVIPNSWSCCDHESFQLRVGPNYKRTNKKAPSPLAFYEPVGTE
jgi:hypothetical protein